MDEHLFSPVSDITVRSHSEISGK